MEVNHARVIKRINVIQSGRIFSNVIYLFAPKLLLDLIKILSLIPVSEINLYSTGLAGWLVSIVYVVFSTFQRKI